MSHPVSAEPGESAGMAGRVATWIGRAARWIGRVALGLAVVAGLLGVAVWGLAVALDEVSGTGWMLVVLVVCLVPAGSFLLLARSARRVARAAGQLPDDLRVVFGHVQGLPAGLRTSTDELRQARGLGRRVRALRHVAVALRGSAPQIESRTRFQDLYELVAVRLPATTTVGLLGLAALVIAIPAVLASATLD